MSDPLAPLKELAHYLCVAKLCLVWLWRCLTSPGVDWWPRWLRFPLRDSRDSDLRLTVCVRVHGNAYRI